MNQTERQLWLIRALLAERGSADLEIPSEPEARWRLLRSLFNIRAPGPAAPELLAVQNDYLQEALRGRGIMDWHDTEQIDGRIHLWRGDITTLRCDAIVNAANSGLTGCYVPCHGCIDNAIHTWAGIQLRLECAGIMEQQGYPEPVGHAKLTDAFNLPCRHVLHTVGPIVNGSLTEEHRQQLAACYTACLELAEQHRMESIAFCCISTGEFRFPRREAAHIAVETVRRHLAGSSGLHVIFNVFTEEDHALYRSLFQ